METNETVETKRGAGRPRTTKRIVYLTKVGEDNFIPRKRGKPENGTHFLAATIDRAVKNSDFQWGVTKIYSQEDYTVNRPSKAKAQSNTEQKISVNVITPEAKPEDVAVNDALPSTEHVPA
jgi:hypothetical protein